MPPQKTQSSFVGRFGKDMAKAQSEHDHDNIDFGFSGDLPAGIEGVAELIKVEIGVVKEGKQTSGQHYFRAEGIVVLPIKTKEGLPIAGRRTTIMETLADTPQAQGKRKTFQDHWHWVINELAKLGVDTREMDTSSDEALNELFQALAGSQTYFGFRTWQGAATPEYPNPRVNQTWTGKIYDFVPPASGGGVVDSSPQAPANGQGTQRPTTQAATTVQRPSTPARPTVAPPRPATANPAQRPTQPPKPPQRPTTGQQTATQRPGPAPKTPVGPAQRATSVQKPPVAPAQSPDEIDSFDDPTQGESPDYTATTLVELVSLANGMDGDAQEELGRRAMFQGWTKDQVDDAENWESIAEFIQQAEEGGGEEAPEENPEELEPEPLAVGSVVFYRPLDKKKQPAKVAVECEIMAIDKRGNFTLKNLENNAEYKGVLPDTVEQQA